MRLAILGATGQTGRQLLAQALAGGHTVVALARRPEAITVTNERLTVLHGDGTKVDDVAKAVAGADAVLVAVGPPGLKASTLRTDVAAATVAAMMQHGVKKLVWLSAFGVSDSDAWARRTSVVLRLLLRFLLKTTYVDAKGAEDVIRASDLAYVVVRPPQLVNGKPKGGTVVVAPDARIPRLKITRSDVASFMLAAAAAKTHDRSFPVIA